MVVVVVGSDDDDAVYVVAGAITFNTCSYTDLSIVFVYTSKSFQINNIVSAYIRRHTLFEIHTFFALFFILAQQRSHFLLVTMRTRGLLRSLLRPGRVSALTYPRLASGLLQHHLTVNHRPSILASQRMSFHFASQDYVQCFFGLPNPDAGHLRQQSLEYLETFDPQTWYQDPVSLRYLAI